MILNESGITKVVNYIGEDCCKYVCINNRHLLLGVFSESDVNKLKGIGIKLNNIGGGLHEAILEEPEIDSITVDGDDDAKNMNQSEISDKEVKQLADMLMPILKQAFPTKDEINNVLQQLQAQAIDPEEMIDGLKMQIKRIKKQSRTHDEVG